MINIILHGHLRKLYGKNFTLAVSNVSEAVKALTNLLPNFYNEFTKFDYEIYHKEGNKKLYINTENLTSELIVNSINLVPVIKGSKSNRQKGIGKIIVAAALLFVAPTLAPVAVALALNGVSTLLTPKPPKPVDQKESSNITSQGTVVRGGTIPLCYGEGVFEVIPVSIEIASSGVRAGVVSTPTNNGQNGGSAVNGGFNWTNPRFSQDGDVYL